MIQGFLSNGDDDDGGDDDDDIYLRPWA